MQRTITWDNLQRSLDAVADMVRRGLPGGPVLLTLGREKRTLDQNAKFHAICRDLARSDLEWMDKRRSVSEWKILLVSAHAVATNADGELGVGLEGELVMLRESTAGMDKARKSSLIEYALAWCAAKGVELQETRRLEQYGRKVD